jgi:hypothetical protein
MTVEEMCAAHGTCAAPVFVMEHNTPSRDWDITQPRYLRYTFMLNSAERGDTIAFVHGDGTDSKLVFTHSGGKLWINGKPGPTQPLHTPHTIRLDLEWSGATAQLHCTGAACPEMPNERIDPLNGMVTDNSTHSTMLALQLYSDSHDCEEEYSRRAMPPGWTSDMTIHELCAERHGVGNEVDWTELCDHRTQLESTYETYETYEEAKQCHEILSSAKQCPQDEQKEQCDKWKERKRPTCPKISTTNPLEHLHDTCVSSEWESWCDALKRDTLPGTCALMQCDCDADTNYGVAGAACELSCPVHPDTGTACGYQAPPLYPFGECQAKEGTSYPITSKCNCLRSTENNCEEKCDADNTPDCNSGEYGKQHVDSFDCWGYEHQEPTAPLNMLPYSECLDLLEHHHADTMTGENIGVGDIALCTWNNTHLQFGGTPLENLASTLITSKEKCRVHPSNPVPLYTKDSGDNMKRATDHDSIYYQFTALAPLDNYDNTEVVEIDNGKCTLESRDLLLCAKKNMSTGQKQMTIGGDTFDMGGGTVTQLYSIVVSRQVIPMVTGGTINIGQCRLDTLSGRRMLVDCNGSPHQQPHQQIGSICSVCPSHIPFERTATATVTAPAATLLATVAEDQLVEIMERMDLVETKMWLDTTELDGTILPYGVPVPHNGGHLWVGQEVQLVVTSQSRVWSMAGTATLPALVCGAAPDAGVGTNALVVHLVDAHAPVVCVNVIEHTGTGIRTAGHVTPQTLYTSVRTAQVMVEATSEIWNNVTVDATCTLNKFDSVDDGNGIVMETGTGWCSILSKGELNVSTLQCGGTVQEQQNTTTFSVQGVQAGDLVFADAESGTIIAVADRVLAVGITDGNKTLHFVHPANKLEVSETMEETQFYVEDVVNTGVLSAGDSIAQAGCSGTMLTATRALTSGCADGRAVNGHVYGVSIKHLYVVPLAQPVTQLPQLAAAGCELFGGTTLNVVCSGVQTELVFETDVIITDMQHKQYRHTFENTRVVGAMGDIVKQNGAAIGLVAQNDGTLVLEVNTAVNTAATGDVLIGNSEQITIDIQKYNPVHVVGDTSICTSSGTGMMWGSSETSAVIVSAPTVNGMQCTGKGGVEHNLNGIICATDTAPNTVNSTNVDCGEMLTHHPATELTIDGTGICSYDATRVVWSDKNVGNLIGSLVTTLAECEEYLSYHRAQVLTLGETTKICSQNRTHVAWGTANIGSVVGKPSCNVALKISKCEGGSCTCMTPNTAHFYQQKTSITGATVRLRQQRYFGKHKRINMMQGPEPYLLHHVKYQGSPVVDWQSVYAVWIQSKADFTCSNPAYAKTGEACGANVMCSDHNTICVMGICTLGEGEDEYMGEYTYKQCLVDNLLLSSMQGTSAYMGPLCNNQCPEMTDYGAPCAGHGVCSQTGVCSCDIASTMVQYSHNTRKVISNEAGETVLALAGTSLTMEERTGWRGDGCERKCLGHDARHEDMSGICTGHGQCLTDTSCRCEVGFTGDMCQLQCPNTRNITHTSCSGHGTCHPVTINVKVTDSTDNSELFSATNDTLTAWIAQCTSEPAPLTMLAWDDEFLSAEKFYSPIDHTGTGCVTATGARVHGTSCDTTNYPLQVYHTGSARLDYTGSHVRGGPDCVSTMLTNVDGVRPQIKLTRKVDTQTECTERVELYQVCDVMNKEQIQCGACACRSHPSYGFWGALDCRTCQMGWGDTNCMDKCPGYDGADIGTICNGIGTCTWGSMGGEGEEFLSPTCVCGDDPNKDDGYLQCQLDVQGNRETTTLGPNWDKRGGDNTCTCNQGYGGMKCMDAARTCMFGAANAANNCECPDAALDPDQGCCKTGMIMDPKAGLLPGFITETMGYKATFTEMSSYTQGLLQARCLATPEYKVNDGYNRYEPEFTEYENYWNEPDSTICLGNTLAVNPDAYTIRGSIISNTVCEVPITSKSDCDRAMEWLSLDTIEEYTSGSDWIWYGAISPNNCFLKSDGTFFFNPHASGSGDCSSGSAIGCICPQPLLIPTCNCPSPTATAECKECPPAKFNSQPGGLLSDCVDCPVGHKLNENVCSACEAGKFQPFAGGTDCLTCYDGEYSSSASAECTECTPSHKSNADHTGCEQCPAGKSQYGPDGATCDFCPQGTKSTAEGCTLCAPGMEATNPPGAECVECTAGKARAADFRVQCQECPIGYASNKKAASCTGCSAGTYQASTGKTSCTECSAGKYQDSTGQSSCTPCSAGKYQDEDGQSSCTECSEGKRQPEDGQTSCTLCAGDHLYQDGTGQSSCKECTASDRIVNPQKTSCDTCNQGYVVNNKRTQCDACPAGKHGGESLIPLVGNICICCPIGTYLDSAGSSENCKQCISAPWSGCSSCAGGGSCGSYATKCGLPRTFGSPYWNDCCGAT